MYKLLQLLVAPRGLHLLFQCLNPLTVHLTSVSSSSVTNRAVRPRDLFRPRARPRVHDDRAGYRATIMTTDVSRRELRNWARRALPRALPGTSLSLLELVPVRHGRKNDERDRYPGRVRFAHRRLISPERAREKEFSTSLIIISSIFANYRSDLTIKIMSRKPRAT